MRASRCRRRRRSGSTSAEGVRAAGWLEQEALRLDLYRRISSAGDHGLLERVRTETVDRFGQLPEEVETLFAVASLRITCARLGVGEVSTYRQQVRIKPLELPEALERPRRPRGGGPLPPHDRPPPEPRPRPRPGSELPSLVERGLVRAVGENEVVATMTP